MNTTSQPPVLRLPVLRHLVKWTEDGEERRRPFQFKSEASAFIDELRARGLEGRHWQV